MKRTLKVSMIMLFAGVIMISCSKSTDEVATPTVQKGTDPGAFFQTPQGKVAIDDFITEYSKKIPATKGSEIIAPFFASTGFGVINFETAELAFFSDDYNENDFWRENPDGTTSVHLNSNTALGEYLNFFEGTYAYGENCHLAVNYTGMFMSFDYYDPFTGEYLFTFYYFDTSAASSAYGMSGNGKVQFDGEGPESNLKAKVVITSSGQSNITVSLN